jgi:azurin
MASLEDENAKDRWLSKALLAAAITHEKGFKAAAEKSNRKSKFSEQIMGMLVKEVYTLGRRNAMLFAPDVKGMEIILRTSITKAEDKPLQGFIAGQGSSTSGYALYIQEGKVFMDVYQHDMAASVATSQPLPDNFDLMASLTKGGKITIKINGKVAAEGNSHMLFMETLPNTLRTGEDGEGTEKISPYEGRFGFVGSFQKATLELQKPNTTDMDAATTVKTKTSTSVLNSNARVIELKVVPEMLQFDKTLLTAKAGEKLIINLENPDGMQHNLLIIKVGTLQKVGKAADELLSNPKAAEMQYVPKISEVLHATKLVNPGETVTLEFTVPSIPGDYPFVCTFPGHWRGMNGILRVSK